MRLAIIGIGIYILLSLTGCLTQQSVEPPQGKLKTEINDSTILSIANQKKEVSMFTEQNPDYDYEIGVLNPENITELSGEYPVIYGGLPNKTLYRVVYKSGTRGILAIVDAGDEKVLKYFRTTGVIIG